MSYYDQKNYSVRLVWGQNGLKEIINQVDVLVIVDVLSFTTCVSMAVSNGGVVYPYKMNDESAFEFSKSKNAILARKRSEKSELSLSPQSMLSVTKGMKIVLPSPNGSTLSLEPHENIVAGCLRNAESIGKYCEKFSNIGIVAAGEKWSTDNSLRPALEDLIGAGSIVSFITSSDKSMEAISAELVFNYYRNSLLSTLNSCGSGIELIAKGYSADVVYAAKLNYSQLVPKLMNNCYRGI